MFSQYQCIYCGAPANVRDHVRPVSHYLPSRNRVSWRRDLVVPCCRDCNASAGSQGGDSIQTKARYLLVRLRQRKAAILRTPDWDEADLAELGHNLGTYTRSALTEKKTVQERLRHLAIVADMEGLSPEKVWDIIDAA